MNFYVVMDNATNRPVYISFSREGAENAINGDPDRDKYSIYPVGQHQSMYSWLTTSMRVAASISIAGGASPVEVPTKYEAWEWALSEIGEAAGAKVGGSKNWKRNNPDKHTEDSFDKECAQAIMMLILASGDPLEVINQQLIKWGYREPNVNIEQELLS